MATRNISPTGTYSVRLVFSILMRNNEIAENDPRKGWIVTTGAIYYTAENYTVLEGLILNLIEERKR